MKKVLLTMGAFLGFGFAYSQVTSEVVSLGAGYANVKWYNMENGEVGTSPAKEWDVAFDLKQQDAAIRINDGNGVRLYEFPGGPSEWENVDTAGIASWNPLFNSEKEWRIGAFNQLKDPNFGQPMFDYGWGTYDFDSKNLSSYRIFVIKLQDGNYKKLWIKDMISSGGGVYHFTYADIDGSNEVNDSIVKSDFNNKNFAYYSLQNEIVIDHEQAQKTDWDLFFGKYVTMVEYGGNYVPSGVAGVLSNENVKIATVENVDDVTTFNDWSGQTFSSDINSIGWEWEGYSMQTHSYNVKDSLVFFIKAQSGDIWKVYFTDFGGTSTGDYEFNKELISTSSLQENSLQANHVIVYPNPASDKVSLILNDVKGQNAKIQIQSINGQIVYENTFMGNTDFEAKNISINHLNSGVYFIHVEVDGQQIVKKLIKK